MYVEIIRSIKSSPQGGTIDLMPYPLPSYGYFVGGAVQPLVLDSAEQLTYPALVEFGESSGSRFLGWWTDEETGKFYLDAVDWHANQDTAARVARGRQEVAFHDIAHDRTLRLAYVEGEPWSDEDMAVSAPQRHGEYALVTIQTEGPDWLEWAGAVYESYASDHDPEIPLSYCEAAHRLAEEIETGVYDA